MEPNLSCRKWQSTIAMKKVPKCNCNVEVSKVPLLCRKYQSTIAMKKGDCARLEATCPLASFPCFLWGNASGNFSYEEIPPSLTCQCQFGQSILECCQHFYNIWTGSTEHKTTPQCYVVNFEGILKIVFDAQGRPLNHQYNCSTSKCTKVESAMHCRAGLSPPPGLADPSSPGVSAYRDLPK